MYLYTLMLTHQYSTSDILKYILIFSPIYFGMRKIHPVLSSFSYHPICFHALQLDLQSKCGSIISSIQQWLHSDELNSLERLQHGARSQNSCSQVTHEPPLVFANKPAREETSAIRVAESWNISSTFQKLSIHFGNLPGFRKLSGNVLDIFHPFATLSAIHNTINSHIIMIFTRSRSVNGDSSLVFELWTTAFI